MLWSDYTEKKVPEDGDELMLYDKKGVANRRTLFSGVWNWLVGKIKSSEIDTLNTEDKTIIWALNEVDSEKANGKGITFSVNESGGLRVTYDDGK